MNFEFVYIVDCFLLKQFFYDTFFFRLSEDNMTLIVILWLRKTAISTNHFFFQSGMEHLFSIVNQINVAQRWSLNL